MVSAFERWPIWSELHTDPRAHIDAAIIIPILQTIGYIQQAHRREPLLYLKPNGHIRAGKDYIFLIGIVSYIYKQSPNLISSTPLILIRYPFSIICILSFNDSWRFYDAKLQFYSIEILVSEQTVHWLIQSSLHANDRYG